MCDINSTINFTRKLYPSDHTETNIINIMYQYFPKDSLLESFTLLHDFFIYYFIGIWILTNCTNLASLQVRSLQLTTIWNNIHFNIYLGHTRYNCTKIQFTIIVSSHKLHPRIIQYIGIHNNNDSLQTIYHRSPIIFSKQQMRLFLQQLPN